MSDPAVPAGLATLLGGVRTLVEEKGLSLREASRLLGRAPNHLGRLLGGRRRLPMVEVFRLLAALELKPEDFFAVYFPFGQALSVDGVPLLPPRQLPDWWGKWVAPLTEQLREQSQVSLWEPEDWAAEVAKALGRLTQAQRGSLARTAARYGWPKDRLGRVLRGVNTLSCEEVFALLEELRVTPGRFFFELSLPETPLADRLRRRQMLDQAEEFLRHAELAIAEGRTGPEPGKPGGLRPKR